MSGQADVVLQDKIRAACACRWGQVSYAEGESGRHRIVSPVSAIGYVVAVRDRILPTKYPPRTSNEVL